MILVVAAIKGGVGKTTASVYLSALASTGKRWATLVDADPQASAAEWLDGSEDPNLQQVSLVEAPTERMLVKAMEKVDPEEWGIIDSPPGNDRMLARAMEMADVVIVPTRVGGVETAQADAVLALVPRRTPAGLVISSARTYTRDHAEALELWAEADVPVWGSIPERVSIAQGPEAFLADDGLEAYRAVWRRASRAAR